MLNSCDKCPWNQYGKCSYVWPFCLKEKKPPTVFILSSPERKE